MGGTCSKNEHIEYSKINGMLEESMKIDRDLI